MTHIYADLDFYINEYLAGDIQIIPDTAFKRRAREASQIIDQMTYDRARHTLAITGIEVNEDGETIEIRDYPEPIKFCMCELVELLYRQAQANDLETLKSESVGDWSGTYADQKIEKKEKDAVIRDTINKWLRPVIINGQSLLYMGV